MSAPGPEHKAHSCECPLLQEPVPGCVVPTSRSCRAVPPLPLPWDEQQCRRCYAGMCIWQVEAGLLNILQPPRQDSSGLSVPRQREACVVCTPTTMLRGSVRRARSQHAGSSSLGHSTLWPLGQELGQKCLPGCPGAAHKPQGHKDPVRSSELWGPHRVSRGCAGQESNED